MRAAGQQGPRIVIMVAMEEEAQYLRPYLSHAHDIPMPGVVGDMILLPGKFPIEAYAERVERSLIARGIVPCAFTGVIPGAYFGVGSE